MTASHLLLLATVAGPVGLLLACLSARARPLVPRLLWLAPLPGLAAALLAAGAPPLVLDAARLRLTLGLDAPAALLLGVAALLWSAAGGYAQAYLGGKPGAGRFAAWWLVTQAGSLGVFVAGDLLTFYLAFAAVSLAAYGLIVHEGTRRARRAGAITLLLAVLGEIALLLGFALLAHATPGESLAIADAVAALPAAPSRGLTVALLVAGFGLKAGLVPLHVWLPLAHPAAPMPASAVLSGAIVKAGVIGLLRFLPLEGAPLPEWGTALAALGLLTAFWGVACGVTQANPKTVLAYSTVSQMGVVAAALGMGLRLGDAGTPMAVAFYAAHHVLAKGALFLAVGVAAVAGLRRGRGLGLVLLPAIVLALGFGGLPPTGGALAKAAVKDELGAGLVGALSTLSAAGSTLLMLHFIGRLMATAPARAAGEARAPAGLLLPWLGLAAAAVVLPWALYGRAGLGDPLETLGGAAFRSATWPVLAGATLALVLRRPEIRLPRVPEGDLLLPAMRALAATPSAAAAIERAEAAQRAWPAAGLALLAVGAALGIALLAEGP